MLSINVSALSGVRCSRTGACLTGEVICAVGCCRSCRVLLSDAVGAVRAVKLLLLSDVGLLLSGAECQVAGCCQALTHVSHTYDTIKR